MDLEVLAEIITGTATLIVAFVLMYQLRQQHKDTEIQISMMSETLNERIHNFGNYDKDYSEVIYKGLKIEFEEFNDLEKWKFERWAGLVFRRIVQDWRLGRVNRSKQAYKIAFNSLFKYKASHYLYLNFQRKALIGFENIPEWKKGFYKISDECFEDITGTKLSK